VGPVPQQIGALLRQQWDETHMRDGGKPGLGEFGSTRTRQMMADTSARHPARAWGFLERLKALATSQA
jgi:hypothetical protein